MAKKPEKAGKRESVSDLVRRAEKGNAGAMNRLLEMGQEFEAGALDSFLKSWGDLGERTETALIKAIMGDHLVAREGLRRNIADMRVELCGPNPSPFERLLVDRIICCWIQLQHVTCIFAWNMRDTTGEWEKVSQRRQDHAQRCFLKAVKTLAEVRRLLGPNIQVNIAEKQVNVLAPGRTADGKEG